MPPSPHELERLLRTARPEPRADFVRTLEASLPAPRVPRTSRPRWRIAFAACASAAALIAVTVVLGIAGVLPFSAGSGKNAQAGQNCRFVFVDRLERVPHVVRKHNGQLHIAYRVERVKRAVKRCR